MLRRIDNPPNPFDGAYREWLEEPPPARLEVYEERAKSILSTNDSPDIAFDWSVNPYRGCQHACAYCYARPYHEYLGWGAGTDFDSRIVVKVNSGELLEAALAKRRTNGEPIAFSGVTDCYQPIEAVYRVMQRCLEACLRHRIGASIVTKSFLVVRDAVLLAGIHHAAGARVFVSIPFFDANLARKVESGAPTPQRRIDALRALSAAGIPTGVIVAPIIPGLNDREIPAILEAAAHAGARWAVYTPLRLPGNVKPVFLERLREALPDHANRVEARLADLRGGPLNDSRFHARMSGQGPYWESVTRLFETTAKRLGFESSDRSSRDVSALEPMRCQPPQLSGAERAESDSAPSRSPRDEPAHRRSPHAESGDSRSTGIQLPLFPGG